MLRTLAPIAIAAAVAGGAVTLAARPTAPSSPVTLPVPALDQHSPSGAALDTAVFAGGCFWGVEGVFEHLKGVQSAVAGYAGGTKRSPSYEDVSSGTTGHAESVEVIYDPSQISYGQLLQVFFSVAHDPTELNYQGPDHGTQYRSAIFYRNAEQQRLATAYVAQLTNAKTFHSPIVTEIKPLNAFWRAEDYHQHYMQQHPDQPYIVYNDAPKVEALKTKFAALYRE